MKYILNIKSGYNYFMIGKTKKKWKTLLNTICRAKDLALRRKRLPGNCKITSLIPFKKHI